jgi:RNA polymerase sigma factor (sigma-70 family)
MTTTRLDDILRHLRRAVRPAADDDTDARLLERFLRHRDEAAFEALVLRHGPMVHGVCRRVLANDDDAEDAFQATFLVLVRKAASIRKRRTLGAWLYGVARRTALEARRAMARRRAKEAAVVPRAEVPAGETDDLREVLDRELSALPERYREVVILCDLEGKGRKEAAREIGCPEGTVASRLARGRSLLAKRLARHGLATAAGAALAQEASSACVPAALVSSTVRAAALTAAGRAAADAVSANVSFLVERVVRAMLVLKLRSLTVVVLLVGAIGSGTGWLAYHRAGAAEPNPADAGAAPAREGDAPEPEKVLKEVELLKADLRRATERLAALEAKLKARGEDQGEVLYRGKPTAYWVKALKDRDPGYRKQAVQALGEIGKVDHSVIPVLAGVLKDDQDEVAGSATFALAGIGKPALPSLLDALKEGGPQERSLVIPALRAMGRKAEAAVPALLEVLKVGSREERQGAALALGDIGPGAKAAVPALLELFKGKEKADRGAATYALHGIGRGAKAAVPTLVEYLRGPDPDTRQAAAQALGGIGPEAKAAVPPLIAMLKSLDYQDRWYAAVVLGGIGPDAREAVPGLLELHRRAVKEPGTDLAKQVVEALERIDPETAAKMKQP